MYNSKHVNPYNLRPLPGRPINNQNNLSPYNLRPRDNKRKRYLEEPVEQVKRQNKRQRRTKNQPIKDTVSWNTFNSYKDVTNGAQRDIKTDRVSATSVKNYLLKDPLLDWLKLYYKKCGFNEENSVPTFIERKNREQKIKKDESQLNILFKMGNKFEDTVCKELERRYQGWVVNVVKSTQFVKPEDMNRTLEYMKKGYPIITQAALYNNENMTFGVADLLIRSDKINEIFEIAPLDETETTIPASNLIFKGRESYHYVVIDIKWTTMMLCSDGKNIRNSQRFPAYKGQLAIYNAALGLLQGYTPEKAYVLAKSYRYQESNTVYSGGNCFEMLGQIDYTGFDKVFIGLTKEAVDWVREVRYNGMNWTCVPPSRNELYPNMCNRFDTPFHGIKKELSQKIHEMTQVWMVGVKNRNHALNLGITKWTDEDCSSETMGINGKRVGPIVDRILEVNRGDSLLQPDIIENNVYNWQTKNQALDFYVDFESINGCFYNQQIDLQNGNAGTGVIFMVGVGYEENNEWVYKCFKMNSCTLVEERRVIQEFIDFVEGRVRQYMNGWGLTDRSSCKPRFYHWGHAERTMFRACDRRHNYSWTNWYDSVDWVDFCQVFLDEPITVKGAMKFNLKEVTKAMKRNGMVETKWDEEGPNSGLGAMIDAADYYRFMDRYNTVDSKEKQKMYKDWLKHEKAYVDIVEYNEVDCKAVYEIVEYLRKNHT